MSTVPGSCSLLECFWPVSAGGRTSKARLRAEILATRRATDPRDRETAAGRMTRRLLELPDISDAGCVAAYLSFGAEPSTSELLGYLRSRGVRVLLPLLRTDLELDWAIYVGPQGVVQGEGGPARPSGSLLGVEAVSEADVVVVPALAVGADGTRLGRGGGSYDRALARVPAGRAVVALLYDGELLPDVPGEEHDRPVSMAVQPTGVTRFGPPERDSS